MNNTELPTPIIRKLFSLELEQKFSGQNHWGNQKSPVSTVLEILPFLPHLYSWEIPQQPKPTLREGPNVDLFNLM